MRAFAVSGYSGTGKTTLVEQIIRALVKEGYTVASVKSTKHDIYGEEGTDSWKHRQAGAKITLILGPTSSSITYEGRRALQSLMNNIDADYLIIEGMKESTIPKVWCAEGTVDTLGSLSPSVKAIISPSGESLHEFRGLPVLDSSETQKIVEIVKREAVDLSELEE